jgi:hypothetical protein
MSNYILLLLDLQQTNFFSWGGELVEWEMVCSGMIKPMPASWMAVDRNLGANHTNSYGNNA